MKTNWILAERLKDIQGERKFQKESGRKRKEAIRSEPVFLEQDSEEQGETSGVYPGE